MKKLLTILTLLISGLTANAQNAPQKFNYQAVARDADGKALTDSEVTLRIAIMSGNDLNRPLYAEEHLVLTNKLGLFNIAIGGGEVLEGEFSAIDWGTDSHYLSVEMDAEGNGNFQQMGTSQLLSVPYALYAERSGSGSDGGSRSDPNDWTINGNSGTDDVTNFIGTTDGQDLVIRAENAEVARFTTDSALQMTSGGRILFGTYNAVNMDGERNIHIGERAGDVSTGNQNAFIGYNAGQVNTTGEKNTFIGPTAGRVNTTGNQNAFIGGRAGFNNTSGSQNSFIGWQAGRDNTTGGENTFIGKYAGLSNTTGSSNTYIGKEADGSPTLSNATAIGASATVTQSNSVVLGSGANVGIGTTAPEAKLHVEGSLKLVDGNQADGFVLTTDSLGNAGWTSVSSLGIDAIADADNDTKIQVEESSDEDVIRFDLAGTEYFVMDGPILEVLNSGNSVFIGNGAGASDDLSNNQNVFVGHNAGNSNTTGSPNVALGKSALQENTTGSFNVALGYAALYNNTTANDNIAIGASSLFNNTTGAYNNAVGLNTLKTQTSGANYNNAFGSEALEANTTGDNNSAFGDLAMNFNTTGEKNTAMGAQALETNQTGSNNVAIGYQAGESSGGSGNIFLGYQAGKSISNSNKLYIENSSSTSPLIYGEFDNDLVRINGELGVEGNINTNYHWISNNGNDQGIYIGDNGYVGINTSTYSAPLNVNGDAEVGGGSSDYDGDSEYLEVRSQSQNWYMGVQNESSASASDFFIGQSYTEDGIFHIQQNGKVGVGTSSPSDLMHIQGTSVRYRAEATDGTYAGFVAENSNGQFFIGVQGTGDPNSGEFHIYDNTAGAQRMVITSAGNVGLGYYGPGYRLRINGQVAGNGAYVNASDRKFKTNVLPIKSAMEKITRLQGVSYDWKTDEFPELTFDDRHQLGFIAQDVEAVVPEAVSIAEDGVYGLSYSTFIPLMVEAMKEQQQQIKSLEAENAALQTENSELKAERDADRTANEARFKRLEELMGVGAKAQR